MKEGQVIYKGRPNSIATCFSSETLKARRACTERCLVDSKRSQMPVQTTISYKTFDYHKRRNQDIPWQSQSVSVQKLNPTETNRRNFIPKMLTKPMSTENV